MAEIMQFVNNRCAIKEEELDIRDIVVKNVEGRYLSLPEKKVLAQYCNMVGRSMAEEVILSENSEYSKYRAALNKQKSRRYCRVIDFRSPLCN